MNVLFSGGDNWWPAIIGSKAVKSFYCLVTAYMYTLPLKEDTRVGTWIDGFSSICL